MGHDDDEMVVLWVNMSETEIPSWCLNEGEFKFKKLNNKSKNKNGLFANWQLQQNFFKLSPIEYHV